MSATEGDASHIAATLSDLGVRVDETDVAVIGALLDTFEPHMRALLEADLGEVVPEVDCDPSQPPA